MNNRLPDLIPGRLLVLAAAHAASDVMLAFAARLGQRGPVLTLDGGNRFNAYRVARELRRLGVANQRQVLARIRVARAFTCYQMLTLLEQTPSSMTPTLVIDFLDTYFDESASIKERQRLVEASLQHLRRLSQQAIVVVSLRPPQPPKQDPTGFIEAVGAAADQYWMQELPALALPARLI